jgi:flagellar assembly factor FliW
MSAAIAGAPSSADTVAVDSLVLGALSVPTSSVFAFPEGLHGFESHREFALVPAAREGLFWLQSLAEREIAFLLVDPFVTTPGYEVDIGAREKTSLDLQDPAETLVFAIVTLPASPAGQATANLRGPVVFNTRRRMAAQILSAAQDRDLRTPVDVLALPPRV